MPKWLGDGKERRNGVEDGGDLERRGGDLVVFIRVLVIVGRVVVSTADCTASWHSTTCIVPLCSGKSEIAACRAAYCYLCAVDRLTRCTRRVAVQ